MKGDEKFKKQKNGNVHRYVYYGCTRSKDKNCKAGYIEEKDLIQQFEGLLTQIDLDEIGIKDKIKKEVERFKKFQRSVLGSKEKIEVKDIDVRNYAKYLLREGEDVEKRELLGCIRRKISLHDKKITLKMD